MSKSNLAVKEELENVAAEDVIIINQNEQENYRPSKDKEIRVNNNLSYLIMKKIVDIIAGILGTILLVPLIAVVWFIRICLHENDGPLFFEQIRIGKNGKQFRMYKFRTMVMEADEKLYRYLEENPEAIYMDREISIEFQNKLKELYSLNSSPERLISYTYSKLIIPQWMGNGYSGWDIWIHGDWSEGSDARKYSDASFFATYQKVGCDRQWRLLKRKMQIHVVC